MPSITDAQPCPEKNPSCATHIKFYCVAYEPPDSAYAVHDRMGISVSKSYHDFAGASPDLP